MSYLITKATLNMANGDKQIIKERIQTPDIEQVRSELHRKTEKTCAKQSLLCMKEYLKTKNQQAINQLHNKLADIIITALMTFTALCLLFG